MGKKYIYMHLEMGFTAGQDAVDHSWDPLCICLQESTQASNSLKMFWNIIKTLTALSAALVTAAILPPFVNVLLSSSLH